MIGEQEVCEMGFPTCKFILENGANFSHQYVHHNMTVILLNVFLSHTCSYCHWPHRSRVYVTVGCTSVRHSVRLSIIRTPLLWVCCWAPGGVRHIERLLHGAPASAHAGSATLTADVWCWIQACFFLTERIGQQQYNGLLLKTCDRADVVCLVKWMSVYNQ